MFCFGGEMELKMIEVEHLTKRYGDKYAVDDISFNVNEGEIVGFLGPNGAGKSTTMNIITGYLSSNDGKVKVAGFDVLDNPIEAKRHIGFLPEQPPLYLDMTVRDYLGFIYDLKGIKLKKKPHIAEICELVKITDHYNRLIKNLSKGYKQRVGLAQALVGNPDVLILDEPTVGLDPKQIIEIRSLIKHLGKKHTVILSSHILPEVQSVCERIMIINRGRIVADDTTLKLSDSLSSEHRLIARIAGSVEAISHTISDIKGVKTIINLGSKEEGTTDYSIETIDNVDIRRQLFNLLAERKWPLMALDIGSMSLEDIFLKLTNDDKTTEVPSDHKLKKREKAEIKESDKQPQKESE
jgi:ABC-2 type transport system ATP-binding protein